MFNLLQASRFGAAFLVLATHAELVFGQPKYFDYHALNGIFSGGIFGVDFFFVLSGFIICYAHWNDIGQPPRLYSYLKRRVQRIYPPYWAAAIIILIPLYFVPSTYSDYIISPSYLAKAFLLLPFKSSYVQVAWTLQHEVMFYLAFAFLILNRALGMFVLGAWFIASGTVYGAEAPSADVFTDPRHVQFLLGMGCAFLVRHHGIPCPRVLLLLGVMTFAACVYVGGPGYGDLTLPGAPNLTVTIGLAAALIVCSLVELERSYGWQTPRLFRYFGDASYSLYLIHLPALTIFVRLIHAKHLDAMIPLPLLFAAGMLVGLGTGVAFYHFVERPIQSIWKRQDRSAAATAVAHAPI